MSPAIEPRSGIVNETGLALVRRFTDEQDGKTNLERATKAAQEEQDEISEEEERERLSNYYKNLSGDKHDVYFLEAEAARKQLDKTCTEFFKVEEPSKLAKMFRFRRKTSRAAANEVMQQYIASDIEELTDVVNGIETKWRTKQSKAFSYFRKLCTTLYAHKLAFALLPSQNDYAATLCGGVTLVISAAVNYDDIAETLSEQVVKISEEVSMVADSLGLIGTQRMYEVYAELHARVFIFYRDVIAWYLDRRLGRLSKSFNEQLKGMYEKAAARIGSCVSVLKSLHTNAQTAILQTLLLNSNEQRRESRRQRQRPQGQRDIAQVGIQMQDLLFAMVNSNIVDRANVELKGRNYTLVLEPEPPPPLVQDKSVDRAAMLSRIDQLATFVVGDEGQSLFQGGRFYIPHAEASPKFVKLMDQDEGQSRLWINSPLTPRGFPSSRAAAMTAVAAAWRSYEPIISHFCERGATQVETGQHPEQTGLVGLMYSLIVQLLQFHVEDDAFHAFEEQMGSLDGSDESWEVALQMFSDLLKATPQLHICVIDDLNVLALSSGVHWCYEFLDTLFEHQQTCGHAFRVLLTTSGNSRVIPDYFEKDERIFVQRAAQEVLQRSIEANGPASVEEQQHLD